jgi:L-lactate permease
MTWDESVNAAVSILGFVVLGYVVLISRANAEQQNESVRESLSRINLDIAKVTLLNKQ